MNNENRSILLEGFAEFGVNLTENQIANFERYHKMLIEWNEKINLTAITDERDVVIKHFIDSISIIQFIPKNALNIIDVGTGAGFPGIPLKVVKDQLNITLLDSLEKRVRFLNSIINEIGISGIRTIHARAEDLGKDKEHRECYDVGTARAVASLSVLCEYILPFVRIGGYFICMKGSDVENEISDSKTALSILGGEIEKVVNFSLPFEKSERNIILIKKIRHTPTKYPRKSGKPTKTPLK
ncbi:MAG TPA: 16S rRNA (guanine(527)-N(7))-methyltransferase RsmG [Thermoclostridium sp.]|nr:16S rRNA (guanine(527)-N(7))-methyltransferase RsmG [Thermoclostridium sp.]